LYRRLSVESVHFAEAREWLSTFGISLRTLDALHLAVAATEGATPMTADVLARQGATAGVSARLISRLYCDLDGRTIRAEVSSMNSGVIGPIGDGIKLKSRPLVAVTAGVAVALALGLSVSRPTNEDDEQIEILDRASDRILAHFGRGGHQLGEFTHAHHIAVDSEGNIYVGEVSTGERVQKFKLVGSP
jgi:hypothetical protein